MNLKDSEGIEDLRTGANRQIRTADLTLTKGALYQLSYISTHILTKMERVAGIEPASLAWKAKVIASIRHPLTITRLSLQKMVEGGGFEPPKAEPSDLQSDPFGHSGTPPIIFYFLLAGKKKINGADCRSRTGDLLITSQLLYQLS